MNIIIMYIYTFYKKDKNIFVNSFIKNLSKKAIYFHYLIFLKSKNKKYFLIIYVFFVSSTNYICPDNIFNQKGYK